MREIAAVCLLFFTTSVYAYRGRPVSDLRFDGRSDQSYVYAVASDGQDFLALIGFRPYYENQYHVFTQKVVDGRPVGPQRRIASGQPVSLVWTGSEYLAMWVDGSAARIGRLSREGSLIAIAPQLSFTPTSLIANGTRVLAVNGGTVQVIAADGSPGGPAITYTVDGMPHGGGPAGNGFALLFKKGSELRLLLLRADGTAILPAPKAIATVDYGVMPHVATDGTDTLITLRDVLSHLEKLRTLVVGANGTVKSERTIDLHTTHSISPRGLVWDGSRYLLALQLQRSGNRYDAAMLRIARNGEPSGDIAWIVETPRQEWPTSLAWNGRDLLMPFHVGSTGVNDIDIGSHCVVVNPATMTGSTPVSFARTLGPHDRVAIAAGNNGYLAAWFDRGDGTASTVRASRIDRQGNYLDGEGIVLGTLPPPHPLDLPTLTIDGDGPQWLVVWSSRNYSNGANFVRARGLSHAGQPNAQVIAIGPGHQADVIWNGAQYVVLRSDGSLHRDILNVDATIASTTVLAQAEELSMEREIHYDDPALTRLGGETVGVYVKHDVTCPFTGFPTPCGDDATVLGRRVERPDAAPFVIATGVWGDPAVATNGLQALVTWRQYLGPRGAFLTAAEPEQPGAKFPIGVSGSIAVDGSDFLMVGGRLSMQKVSANGMVSEPTALRLDDTEISMLPVIASSATIPPLIGFLQRDIASESVPRAALLFASELDDEAVAPPIAPAMICSTKNADGTITVRWQPMQNILGMSIELELPDGQFRQIGVAPSNATNARVTTAGLEGDAVRVRAWNAGGLSEPSAIAPSLPAPIATLRSTMRACAGTPATISVSLSGTPPFTIRWSDGLVQSNVNAMTATRTVTVTRDTTFTITSVADASCAINEVPESIRITVDPQPAIENQSPNVRINSGQTATLTVTATDATAFAWFEGRRGDTSRAVGGNASTFTTPVLTQSTQYWVRVSNRCGSIDSQTMNVLVNGRRRAARR